MFTAATDKRVAVFLADGMEEIEALTVVDLLFRAGIPCETVSITNSDVVSSSHEVSVVCDREIGDTRFDFDDYDMIVLPGGMPGTTNLLECDDLCDQVCRYAKGGRRVSAICAAPTILAKLGLLEGRRATCFPDMLPVLAEHGVQVVEDEAVVEDGPFITSRGMGTAIPFGLAIVAHYLGKETADELARKIVYSC
jgi:4-methyl-5(b-hydroxyethyl)-thiazole monophosphate biosynthesis